MQLCGSCHAAGKHATQRRFARCVITQFMCRDSLKTCLNYDGTSNKKLMVRTVCALLQRSPLHQAVVLSQSIASDRAERTRAARHP